MAPDLGSARPIIGVLAGEDFPLARLAELLKTAGYVAAADRGADRCLAAGRAPDVLLGDLDSVRPETVRSAPVVLELPDQNLSDADKLLAHLGECARRQPGTPVVVAAMEGDRLDHVLATLQSVARANLPLTLVLRNGYARVVTAGQSLAVPHLGPRRVSALPLTASHVRLTGVRWPVDGALDPLGLTSLSNEAEPNARAIVTVQSGAVAVIWEASPSEPAPWTLTP
ncbi:MAG: thiamine diphosphokinase [Fimbriimonadaceae bacterium]|nr:thiamine diphosphokinase [Fimbriimonadaceae bacterium]